MLSILVANVKGGCGKTTVATHLAAAAAVRGERVVLADLDRQRSSLSWVERRPAEKRAVAALDWSKAISDVPKGVDRLVVDAPAAMRPKDLDDLIRSADVVLLPIMPGAYDEHATRRFIAKLLQEKPIAKGRTPVAVIASRIRLNTRSAARLDVFLGEIGFPAVAHIRDTQLYNEVAASGESIFDHASKRALDYAADWAPLENLLARSGD